MLLRANVLATGHSGCRALLVDCLFQMLCHDVAPRIPEKGSVGASGDLAPLAHLALAMIGEGECRYEERWTPSLRYFGGGYRAGPAGREGRAGAAERNPGDGRGRFAGSAPRRTRHETGRRSGRSFARSPSRHTRGVRPAYSCRAPAPRPDEFRGASYGATRRQWHPQLSSGRRSARTGRLFAALHAAGSWRRSHGAGTRARDREIESGSATDNPLVFTDTEEILSGGNFHGAPLALVYDYAAIALTDLMSITERRIDRLINPDLNDGLPPFLSAQPGLSSGYMIAHVCAASLA